MLTWQWGVERSGNDRFTEACRCPRSSSCYKVRKMLRSYQPLLTKFSEALYLKQDATKAEVWPGHFCRHLYWEQAFPQYGLGYDAFLKSLESMESDLPGLFYSGIYTGILGTKSSLLGLAYRSSMCIKSKCAYQPKIRQYWISYLWRGCMSTSQCHSISTFRKWQP